MSEEAGGLSHHQEAVVEEDEVRGDRADLRTVTDINTNNINTIKRAYHAQAANDSKPRELEFDVFLFPDVTQMEPSCQISVLFTVDV